MTKQAAGTGVKSELDWVFIVGDITTGKDTEDDVDRESREEKKIVTK